MSRGTRVCGERMLAAFVGADGRGSAPRVRGTAWEDEDKNRRGRFSPACAGNGIVRPQMPVVIPVQPRVCGERASHGLR